jgi:HEPN domain-containing protein
MDESKINLVRSWLTKAQHDLSSAERLADGPNPILDTAIYHCQQAVEKTLKGFLVFHDAEFEKVHNLSSLVDLCTEVDKSFGTLTDTAANLTPFATAYRYPDEFFEAAPSREQFDEALEQAKQVLDFVFKRLPKETQP